MSRSIGVWIEVPQTTPADGASTSRPQRPRAVRLTVATSAEPQRGSTRGHADRRVSVVGAGRVTPAWIEVSVPRAQDLALVADALVADALARTAPAAALGPATADSPIEGRQCSRIPVWPSRRPGHSFPGHASGREGN
jgi:hypothetical protein